MSNRKPSKPPLSSSGMDIPGYAIHQLALCLLPLMRQHFEVEEIKRAEGRNITTNPAQMPAQQAKSALQPTTQAGTMRPSFQSSPLDFHPNSPAPQPGNFIQKTEVL